MTAFECDEPADFMHLMLTLRESEASRYTERDTPIFVGRASPIREALDVLDGAAIRRRDVARSLRVACARRARCATSRSRRARRRPGTRQASRADGRTTEGAAMSATMQHRRAVEDDVRAGRPARDLLAAFPPDEIDEERDREEERDLREQRQGDERLVELKRDDHGRDERDDQEAAHASGSCRGRTASSRARVAHAIIRR